MTTGNICTVIDCRLSWYMSDRNRDMLLVQYETSHRVDITFKNCIMYLHLICYSAKACTGI